MALEGLKGAALKGQNIAAGIHTWKYKLKAIGSAIFSFILIIIGLYFLIGQKNFMVGGVIILVGLLFVGLSYLSFKSARHLGETKAGMRGSLAQRRLMKRERKK